MLLRDRPTAPAVEKKTDFDIYLERYEESKTRIWQKTTYSYDEYLLKTSKSVKDYFYMLNKIEIKDLAKFIINYALEG